MKRKLMISALVGVAALASTPAFAATNMTASKCQPLSSKNYEECCAAAEWREFILPGEHRYCPPLNTADKDSGRKGIPMTDTGTGGGGGSPDPVVEVPDPDPVVPDPDPVVVIPDPDPDVEVPDPDTATIGNPGNDKAVGGAGEKGKDNESPSTGTKGSSN